MTLAMKMMEECKEGRREGVVLVAIGMLKKKFSLESIHAATEFPIDTIRKLAEENNISI